MSKKFARQLGVLLGPSGSSSRSYTKGSYFIKPKVYNKTYGFVNDMGSGKLWQMNQRDIKAGTSLDVNIAYYHLKQIIKRNPEFMEFCIAEAKKRQFQNVTGLWAIQSAMQEDDSVMAACITEALARGYDLTGKTPEGLYSLIILAGVILLPIFFIVKCG